MVGERPVFEQLVLLVSNLKRSKEFYLGKLRFEPEYEGHDFVILRTGGPRLLLHESEDEAVHACSHEMEVRVDDVDRWYERLSKEGASFRRAPFRVGHEGDPWSPRREARLSDPDGYGITMFTPLKG